ncbi:MAG: M23 family metallopeptidase [bacterium]|nr:M23 family metallopeptidase [bacterium]
MMKKSILIILWCAMFLVGCVHTPFYYWSLEAQTGLKPGKGVYHKIEKGQTLWRIAKTYGVSVEELIKINKIEDITNIKIGQQIFIPGATEVLNVDVYIPPKIVDVCISSPPKEEYMPPAALSISEQKLLIRPIEGKIISYFGIRGDSMHNGIDIKAQTGTLIKAAADGVVTYSKGTYQGYGNAIIITHDKDELTTVYAHNSVNLVHEGQRVKQGDIIGKVGQTGNATTPHLHFEVWKGLIAQNPCSYLP